MTRWRYVGVDAAGRATRGTIAATSEHEAITTLRDAAIWVTHVTATPDARPEATPDAPSDAPSDVPPATPSDGPSDALATATTARPRPGADRSGPAVWRPWSRPTADLTIQLRAMASLLDGGVPLVRTLQFAVAQARDPQLRQLFSGVLADVLRGRPLSAALEGHALVPAEVPAVVASGEATGTLAHSLTRVADALARREAVRQRLIRALTYPAILGIASVMGTALILVLVVPRFAALITDGGGTLPLSTRGLLALSDLLRRGWWMLPLLGGLGLLVRARSHSPAGQRQLDRWRLEWPVVGWLGRTRAAAGYTATLAVALETGVPLLRAMALARGTVPNVILRDQYAAAETRVGGGLSIAEALAEVLPPLTQQFLAAGEASGDLPAMANRAAESAAETLEHQVTQAVTLVEPVLILGFGGVVGFVALALLQAIYGLNATVL